MSDKKTPLNTIRESLHGALLKCAQYAQNPARDPQEVDYALCVLVPEEIEEALAALRSMEGSEPVGPYTIQRHPDGDRWQVIGPHGFTSQWKYYELAKILRDEQNAAHPPAPAVVELSHVIKAGDATFDAWLEEVKGDGWPEPSLGFIVHKDKWINVTKPFRP